MTKNGKRIKIKESEENKIDMVEEKEIKELKKIEENLEVQNLLETLERLGICKEEISELKIEISKANDTLVLKQNKELEGIFTGLKYRDVDVKNQRILDDLYLECNFQRVADLTYECRVDKREGYILISNLLKLLEVEYKLNV